MSKFISRKWTLAAAFTVVGCIGFLLGKLSGAEFVSLALGITGLFGGADVAEKVIQQRRAA